MKKVLYMVAALVLSAACTQKIDPDPAQMQLPVNFSNTSGDWVLTEWKGNDMQDTQVYLRLKNKEFVIWQSVGTMYPQKYTGSYNLIEEEGVGMIIRGVYDYTYEYWDNQYVVSSLTSNKMIWTNREDAQDTYSYTRTDSFPE